MFVGGVNMGDGSKTGAKLGPGPFPKPSRAVEHEPEDVANAGLFTIAELYARKAELAGQQVSVKGQVVKVSKSIMGKNWIHITDGSGEGDTGRLIFTSPTDIAAVGDELTATGILETDLNLGSGYFYEVIVQWSKFSK